MLITLLSVVIFLLLIKILSLKIKLKETKQALKASSDNFSKLSTTLLSNVLAKYFENTEITNFVINLKYNQLRIRIGDDTHMVDVSVALMDAGLNVALDEARERWNQELESK